MRWLITIVLAAAALLVLPPSASAARRPIVIEFDHDAGEEIAALCVLTNAKGRASIHASTDTEEPAKDSWAPIDSTRRVRSELSDKDDCVTTGPGKPCPATLPETIPASTRDKVLERAEDKTPFAACTENLTPIAEPKRLAVVVLTADKDYATVAIDKLQLRGRTASVHTHENLDGAIITVRVVGGAYAPERIGSHGLGGRVITRIEAAYRRHELAFPRGFEPREWEIEATVSPVPQWSSNCGSSTNEPDRRCPVAVEGGAATGWTVTLPRSRTGSPTTLEIDAERPIDGHPARAKLSAHWTSSRPPQRVELLPIEIPLRWRRDGCVYQTSETPTKSHATAKQAEADEKPQARACPELVRLRDSASPCTEDESATTADICAYRCVAVESTSLVVPDTVILQDDIEGESFDWRLRLGRVGRILRGFTPSGGMPVELRSGQWKRKNAARRAQADFIQVVDRNAEWRVRPAKIGVGDTMVVSVPGKSCHEPLRYTYVGDREYREEETRIEPGGVATVRPPGQLARRWGLVIGVGPIGTLVLRDPELRVDGIDRELRLTTAIGVRTDLVAFMWPPASSRFAFEGGVQVLTAKRAYYPIGQGGLPSRNGTNRWYVRTIFSGWFVYMTKYQVGLHVGGGVGWGQAWFRRDNNTVGGPSPLASVSGGIRVLSLPAGIFTLDLRVMGPEHVHYFKTDFKGDPVSDRIPVATGLLELTARLDLTRFAFLKWRRPKRAREAPPKEAE